MDLDPAAVEPLYEQLAQRLRDAIASGEIAIRVPSAKTLAQQYEVSVGTAERALRLLREQGVIRSAMGRGHFVVRPGESGQT